MHGLSLGLVGLWFWLDLGCGGMLHSCLSGGFSIVLVMCWLVDFVFRFVGFVFWFWVWLFCWFVVDRFLFRFVCFDWCVVDAMVYAFWVGLLVGWLGCVVYLLGVCG